MLICLRIHPAVNEFKTIQTFGLILILLSAMSVSAQAPDEKAYLMEVVVFENLGPDSADNEIFGQGIDLKLVENPPRERPETEEPELSYTSTGTLDKIITALRNSDRFNLLTNLAWTQPATDKQDAPVVSINEPASLSGHVLFFAKKLLFVELELGFNRPLTNITGTTVPYSSPYYQTPVYVIDETRRLKLNEIHYFDHPRFGVLVKVSRHTPAS